MRAMGERGKGDGLRSSSKFHQNGYQFQRHFFFDANPMDSCFCERLGMARCSLVLLTFLYVFSSRHDLHTSCYHALLCAYARLHDIISYAFVSNFALLYRDCFSFLFFCSLYYRCTLLLHDISYTNLACGVSRSRQLFDGLCNTS